jgi:hypothetical protein
MNHGRHADLKLINPRCRQPASHHFLSFINRQSTQHRPKPDPFAEIAFASQKRQQPAPTGQYD